MSGDDSADSDDDWFESALAELSLIHI